MARVTRNRFLVVRLSDDEYAALKRAAKRVGRPLSTWARQMLMNEWARVLGEKPKEGKR